MALASCSRSSSAMASLDVGHLCKLSVGCRGGGGGGDPHSLPVCKHRDGFPALHSQLRTTLHHFAAVEAASPPAAAAAAAADATTELEAEQSEVIKRRRIRDFGKELPFKLFELQTGGAKPWHPAPVMDVKDLAPGIRSITLEVECSRELVALEDAYITPGQQAQVKVNGGEARKVPVACPPFTKIANDPVLYKLRGDISAGMTKQAQYFLSVKIPLELLVFKADNPELFSLKQGDEVEVGPFDYSGLDLRPILFLSRFPTILLFASGKGISAAKAIIEAKDADVGSLSLGRREDSRLFYWASDPSLVLYEDLFEKWEESKLKVRTAVGNVSGQEWSSHVGSFTTLWDEDDIEYDPEATAVIVCVEPELKKEVQELLEDAGISDKQILYWQAL